MYNLFVIFSQFYIQTYGGERTNKLVISMACYQHRTRTAISIPSGQVSRPARDRINHRSIPKKSTCFCGLHATRIFVSQVKCSYKPRSQNRTRTAIPIPSGQVSRLGIGSIIAQIRKKYLFLWFARHMSPHSSGRHTRLVLCLVTQLHHPLEANILHNGP